MYAPYAASLALHVLQYAWREFFEQGACAT